MPSKDVILIDFDNFFKKEIFNYSDSELEYILIRIIDKVLKKTPDVLNISIRLYSGWYEDEQLSKKASLAMQLFSKISIFPIILRNQNRIIHGDIEFATELLEIPNFKWFHTFKERAGIPHLRINKEKINSSCNSAKELCPIHILSSFTKSKTRICKAPNCNNLQKDVFITREQKMVDTIIACDIISLFEDSEIHSIFLISDDMDHLPALAFGSIKNKKTKNAYLFLSNEKIVPVYNSIISNFKIEIILLP